MTLKDSRLTRLNQIKRTSHCSIANTGQNIRSIEYINISSSDEEKIVKSNVMVEDITSSDEEPILLHTLRTNK